MVCFALSEADAGSDVWGIKTRAKRDGDDWVINGSKQWITNSPYSDYAVVFAITNEEMIAERKGGISAFFVETAADGYTFDGVLPVMGHQGGDCGSMSFENVRLPADRLVGVQDQGFQIAMFGISEGRISISANCIGMCDYALDRSLEYAQQRISFGKPISEYQAIQFMLADMAIDIYTMKYMVLQTAALVENVPADRTPAGQGDLDREGLRGREDAGVLRPRDPGPRRHGAHERDAAERGLPHRPHAPHPGRHRRDPAPDDSAPDASRRHRLLRSAAAVAS